MIYIIFFFVIIIIFYTNIAFYRNCDYELDIHKFKKINLNDLEDLYKLRQPIKFNYTLNTINVDNLNTIFNEKKVCMFNTKTKKIEMVKWKKNKKNYIYLIATFLSNRNKEFKPKLCCNIYENYLVLNKDTTTIPKYTNLYKELITPVNGECKIRIVKNDEKNYFEKIKFINENDIYFNYDLFNGKTTYKEIVLKKGECILIPSKWIYSIKAEDDVIIFNQSWDTYINKFAHTYEYFKYHY